MSDGFTIKAPKVKKVNAGIMPSVAYGIGESVEPDFKIGFENNSPLEYAHVVDMNEEIESKDVDLSTLKPKKNLNKKFWKDDRLDSRVRLRLLKIADEFEDSLAIPWASPKDVIMTGSLANYNWDDDYSDIDLHLIYDFSDIDEKEDFVKNYVDAKKKIWNDEHGNISIYGFNVELYVQSDKEPHASSGVYSLDKDKWLVKPEEMPISIPELKDGDVKTIVASYYNIAELLLDKAIETNDKYILRWVYKKASDVWASVKALRTENLSGDKAELSTGNLIFKALRRNGTIERLIACKSLSYNKFYSL